MTAADSKDCHPGCSLASNPGLLQKSVNLEMEGLIPEVEGPCLPNVQGMRCDRGMSEVRWGLAGQASEPEVSCRSEAVSALDRTASTERQLLNNGHIWSEYTEVAGHGLLLSEYQNFPCQEHGTTRAGDFMFSNSQGKRRLGTGSTRSWGESPGLILAHHISSHRAFTHAHTVPCS